MNRSRAVRVAAPLTAIVLAAGGGAWALARRPAPTARVGTDRVAAAAYHTFEGCPDLLAYLRSHAAGVVGPYGLDDGRVFAGPIGVAEPGRRPEAAGSAGSAPAAGTAEASGTTSATGTNIQVAGVDEADVSKRSGNLVLTVAGPRDGLTVLRTSAGHAVVAGRLATTWRPEQLLVEGTTVLLVGTLPTVPTGGPATAGSGTASGGASGAAPGTAPVPPPVVPGSPAAQRTRIAQVDLADPASPRLVRTLDVGGAAVGARLADGVVRLAFSARPSLPFVSPSWTGTGDAASLAAAEAKALARNRQIVATSTAADWLPSYTMTGAGGHASSGSLLGCRSVGVPDRFSGLGTLALLTFDLRGQGIAHWQGAGVVAGGSTLYSTGDHTYVATTQWQRTVPPVVRVPQSSRPPITPIKPVPPQTEIHAFSTDAAGVSYLGSGTVDGTLLGSYALDEFQGRLRVASTTAAGGGGVELPLMPGGSVPAVASAAASAAASSSAVTVLQLRDGRLVQVGRVGGLGTTETIKAVRFAGPVGYVVTFRQTDPLYTLDLADPAHPAVAGQVALPGYSAYLHPVGNGLLLGVGEDAAANGEVRGVLLSLFDVADPARPRLLDRATLPGDWSGTQVDPHAFTYADGLALVPVGDGVLSVRVQGRALGTPSVLRLGIGAGGEGGDGLLPGIDASQVRDFVDQGTIWTVAPEPQGGELTAHDARTLDWLSAVTF